MAGVRIGTTRGEDQPRREAGFTLIEVMIVVLVIGVLMGIGVPTYLGARDRAQDSVARSSLDTAATTALVLVDMGTNFVAADPTALADAEPSLVYVASSVESSGPGEISVDTSVPGQWTGVVRSASGTCFGVTIAPYGRTDFVSPSCSASLAGVAVPIPITASTAPPPATSPPATTPSTSASTTTTTAPSTTTTTVSTTTTTVPTTTTTTAPSTTTTPKTTTTTAPTTTTTTAKTTTTLPACSTIAIDSFQQTSYTFAFQLRNTTAGTVQFSFVIPGANYQLTKLEFSGSGKDMAFTQVKNGSGTIDITVTGTLPAYESAGGQQPNGFNGTVNPTSGKPFVSCQAMR